MSLTDNRFYADFIATAHAHGLKVMQAAQDAPDFSITSEQYGRWDDLRRTPQYWDGWFTEWQAWVVERAGEV